MIQEVDQRNHFAAERTLLAAERTLLAWTRTAIALMGFGFVIERSGILLLRYLQLEQTGYDLLSSLTGLFFLLVGVLSAAIGASQYKSILSSVQPKQIPEGYSETKAIMVNWCVFVLGLGLTALMVLNFLD